MEINRPLFSIVTVCYNSEKTIARTLQSVLAQEFKDYEYLIVDGASTDTTIDIVQQYKSKFCGRMKFRSEPDKGIYDAFNKGVFWASGIYVWIVNSDDYIEPDALIKLEKLIRGYKGENLPIISAMMNFISPSGRISKVYGSSLKSCQDAYKNFGMGLNHPATLVPKQIYDSIGFFDDRFAIMADIDWFLRAFKSHMLIEFPQFVITNMCYGGISTTVSFKKLYKDRQLLFKKHSRNFFIAKMHLVKWALVYFRDYYFRDIYNLNTEK